VLASASETIATGSGNDRFVVGTVLTAATTRFRAAATTRSSSTHGGDSLVLTAPAANLHVAPSAADDRPTGATGNVAVDARRAAQAVTLLRQRGADTLDGTVARQHQQRWAVANSIVGAGGQRLDHAGSGADTIVLGAGSETIASGAGNDRYVVGHGSYSASDTVTAAATTRSSSTARPATAWCSTARVPICGSAARCQPDGRRDRATGNVAVDASALTQAVTLLGNTGADTLTGTGSARHDHGAGRQQRISAGAETTDQRGNGANTITLGHGNNPGLGRQRGEHRSRWIRC